jgi:hypothetical protein
MKTQNRTLLITLIVAVLLLCCCCLAAFGVAVGIGMFTVGGSAVSEEPVTVEMIIDTLNRNARLAQQAVQILARQLAAERQCSCGAALSSALITRPDMIPPETRQRLNLLVGKYLKA